MAGSCIYALLAGGRLITERELLKAMGGGSTVFLQQPPTVVRLAVGFCMVCLCCLLCFVGWCRICRCSRGVFFAAAAVGNHQVGLSRNLVKVFCQVIILNRGANYYKGKYIIGKSPVLFCNQLPHCMHIAIRQCFLPVLNLSGKPKPVIHIVQAVFFF